VKARRHDTSIIDYFSVTKSNRKTINLLNQCRLYLQVMKLSNIFLADGLYILPEIKSGTKLTACPSQLNWPNQGVPSWKHWEVG
jgi:hypothetical protein